MKLSSSAKFAAAAALAVAAFGATSAAHARSDVYFSVGVQGVPVYVEPAPVYVQPRPVYVQPQPVYYGNTWERSDYYRGHRFARRHGPYGDLDRDGIANMDDRDRDGDGVRNRHDRFPDNPYRY
jgi:hypothetical protein